MLHAGITRSGLAPFPLLPVHHINMYPVLIGRFSKISPLSTVYVVGLVAHWIHQLRLYVIVYVSSSQAVPAALDLYPFSHIHFAYKLAGAVDHVVTDDVIAEFEYHPPKIECALVGDESVVMVPFQTVPVKAITAHVHQFA